jgi:hypothetical protein
MTHSGAEKDGGGGGGMAPVVVVVEKIFLELIAFLIFCVFDLLHVTLFCEHHKLA